MEDSNGPVQDILFTLVSERTGYPAEFLSRDQNLEVDLGIDSIKRVEILGVMARRLNFGENHDINSLAHLKTLGRIINYLEENGTNGACRDPLTAQTAQKDKNNHKKVISTPVSAKEGVPDMPFQGEIMVQVPGQEVRVRKELDVEQDCFLKDHSLGGKISQEDSNIIALPVLPFTISLEIMEEAASLIFPPNMSLITMKHLKIHRWITFERQKLLCEIQAKAIPGSHQACVGFYISDPLKTNARPAVEGLFEYGDEIPMPPSMDAFELDQDSPCSIPPEDFYPSVTLSWAVPQVRLLYEPVREQRLGSIS